MKIRWPRRRTLLLVGVGVFTLFLATTIGGFYYLKAQFLREQPNKLTFVGDLYAVPFQWSAARYGEYVEPHNAMVIEVAIPGIDTPLHMQFDTGSPYTFLRSGAVAAIHDRAAAVDAVDDGRETLASEFALEIGGNRVRLPVDQVRSRSASIDWDDPEAINLIGTIGADFLDRKVCAIDFASQTIHLYESRPESLNAMGTFTPFSFQGRRVLLPVKIDGVDQYVFYDSGCSAFGLFTSKYHFDRHARADGKSVSYSASRHGDPIPIHHQTTDAVAQFGEVKIPLGRVSYVDHYTGLQRGLGWLMKGGVLGNKSLTACTLILDAQQSEFLIVTTPMHALPPANAVGVAITNPVAAAVLVPSPPPSVGSLLH